MARKMGKQKIELPEFARCKTCSWHKIRIRMKDTGPCESCEISECSAEAIKEVARLRLVAEVVNYYVWGLYYGKSNERDWTIEGEKAGTCRTLVSIRREERELLREAKRQAMKVLNRDVSKMSAEQLDDLRERYFVAHQLNRRVEDVTDQDVADWTSKG